jgi:hypothetical protein
LTRVKSFPARKFDIADTPEVRRHGRQGADGRTPQIRSQASQYLLFRRATHLFKRRLLL